MGPDWVYMVGTFAMLASSIAAGTFVGIYFGLPLALKKEASKIAGDPDPRSASEIVRERYARGEISRQEYETLRDDLAEKIKG